MIVGVVDEEVAAHAIALPLIAGVVALEAAARAGERVLDFSHAATDHPGKPAAIAAQAKAIYGGAPLRFHRVIWFEPVPRSLTRSRSERLWVARMCATHAVNSAALTRAPR